MERLAGELKIAAALKRRDIEAIQSLLKDSDIGIRCRAAMALGKLKDRRATDSLIEALRDTDSAVRAESAFALSQIRDERAIPALIEALGDEEDPNNVGRKAAYALARLGDAASAALIQALDSDSKYTRHWAPYALAQKGGRQAVELLLDALRHHDPERRRSTIGALASMEHTPSVEQLAACLDSEFADVREFAVRSLGESSDERAIDLLIASLADQSEDVRRAATYALSMRGDAAALPALEEMVRRESGEISTAADYAIDRIEIAQGEGASEHRERGTRKYSFALYADYYQFYIGDSQSSADTSSTDFWTQEAHVRRLAVLPGLVGVSTARYDTVPVTLEIRNEPPNPDLEGWDHVADASLQVPSGRIAIEGCLSYEPDKPSVDVEPGVYRVRVYYGGLREGQLEVQDFYKIVLWPQAFTAPTVLKSWVAG